MGNDKIPPAPLGSLNQSAAASPLGAKVPLALMPLLSLASGLYRGGYQLRQWLYASGRRTTHRLPLPVISVGNITLGGSGKTTFAQWLAATLHAGGQHPAILIRGYRGLRERQITLLSQHSPELPWQEVGDEAFVLAQNLPHTPIVVGKNRFLGALYCREKFHPSLFILDDGFQHLALARDLDLVLIDCIRPLNKQNLFPRGILREPLAALRRASALVLTYFHPDSATSQQNLDFLNAELSSLPLFRTHYEPIEIVDQEGKPRPIDFLQGKKFIGFCGLGNPDNFQHTLRSLPGELLQFLPFPDHHVYQVEELKELLRRLHTTPAELLLTTQKDLIKLPELSPHLYSVKIRLAFHGDDEQSFSNFLQEHLSLSAE